MSLSTPESVQNLQRALHVKAKESPVFRFYSLYDKVCRDDVLARAWRICRRNGGAAGVDRQSFQQIEDGGLERWIGELANDLKSRTYRPDAVRRVMIPKPNGKLRPLGIPTIRDRVVQTAVVIVLEPIFEADMPEEQYGYRPGRSALDAVQHVHRLLNRGHREVVDADLKGYFDTIPHGSLMKSVARRVADRGVLSLIKSWLEAPVEEEETDGKKVRTTRNKDEHRGTPQGSPLSPLLSNLYMRRFILAWKMFGHEKRLGAEIVNYADDFVICCRRGASEAMRLMREIMERIGLTVNEEKTQTCRIPEDRFDFLGYSIGRWYSERDGHPFIGTRPSRKAVSRMLQTISEQTSRRYHRLEVEDMVTRLNRSMLGWRNYFRLGPVSRSYQKIDGHARYRLRRWLGNKRKESGKGVSRYSVRFLYQELGLVQLAFMTPDFSCAKT